ncbi:hypothetical protein JCM8097_004452 [Rhodosporidiobolus ruineniae]
MKLSSLFAGLALAGTACLATAVPRNLVDLAAAGQQLDKRAPAPEALGDLEGSDLVARGGHDDKKKVNVDVNVKVRVKSGRPSGDYRDDGSGFGYGVDWNGHGPPSWCPDGWQWYGRNIGWAPYRGWQPPHNWQPSVIIIRIFNKISWWSPPAYARNYWYSHWDRDYYRYGIPRHWNWRPRNYPGGGRGGWYSKGGGYYWRFHGRGGHKRDEVDGAADEE